MAGFKNGALALKKKDIGVNADPGFIHILVDTSNNLYTIDEFGVYRSIAGYDIISSGSDISVVTSGGTKILSLNSTSVVSGTYGTSTSVPQIVVDNKGRILSAYNIPISASGLGTVTSISISSSTLKVINSPITTFGTFGVNLSATGVVSGSILRPFVDSYGRVLSGGLISATDISDRSADGLLASNSDNKIPTEQAVKTYVDLKTEIISLNFLPLSGGTLTGKIILSAVNPINIPSNSYYSFAAGDIINYSGLKGNFPSFSIINPASNTYESGASFILSNSTILPNNKWTMQLASSGLDFWHYSGLSPIKRMGISNTTGKIEAVGYKTFTGTSAQFLKADGSVDSNSYATTSAVENYLPLSGGTMTGTVFLSDMNQPIYYAFSSGGDGVRFVNNGSGRVFRITNNSTGNGMLIANYSTGTSLSIQNSLSGSGPAISTNSNIIASAFNKSGGTSAQFLKADGSVDSATYATISYVGNYLPLSGGTLTGQLNGSNGSFSGFVAAGNSRIQTEAVNGNGAWFGYVGKNNPGAYIGVYATSAGSLRIASQTTQTVNIGTGENYDSLIVKYSGILVNGNVSAGNAAFGTWSGNADYAWFGHYNQNNVVNGYSGILHRDDGTMVIYAPINKAIYLGINSSTVAQIINTGVDVIGNISASGNIEGNKLYAKGDGTGNIFVGNDSVLGDINQANVLWLYGQQNSSAGYIKFGNDSNNFGYNGSGINYGGNLTTNSFIKSGGISSQFLKADGSVDNNSYATLSYVGNYLPLSGGTMSGEISFVDVTTGYGSGIGGIIGNNDGWKIRGYSTGTNGGALEIATSDDGTEPIYFRQYTGWFSGSYRQLTLMDGSGNSDFPASITCRANYYVSNYSGGGTPALITNTGNARFYTLSLVDHNSTTGGGSLLFTDANIGATGGSYFSNGGKQNAIQLKGSGDPGYGGLYFGQNNTEYIGVKGSGYLYLGSSTKVQIDSNQIQLFSTGSSTYNSTYDISISSTNGNVSLVAGSNLNTTSIYNTTIAANSQLSLTAHSNLSILCDSNVYINSTSGIIYTQATQNSKNIQNNLISVTATTAATTATNIYALPDDYNVYFLAQGTTTAYRNYRLPTPPSPKHIVLICGDSASGNLLCTIIRPSGRILYNSSGSSILSFQRGGAIPLYYDGTDWYCAVTV